MSAIDDDLLARLNALKPSTVNLKDSQPDLDIPISPPSSREDRLADRLQILRAGRSTHSALNLQSRSSPENELREKVKDEAISESDPIRIWQQQDVDDQMLEDLLANLNDDQSWRLDPDDPKSIQALMKEAKEFIPSGANAVGQPNSQNLKAHPSHASLQTQAREDGDLILLRGRTEDENIDEEANEYVQRVLAELDVDERYGVSDDQQEESAASTVEVADHRFDLPSAPSEAPELAIRRDVQPPSYDDSELEARFSNLAFKLPATPTASPSLNTKKAAGKTKPISSLPVYTADDIDSWCCICNEDGDVRCLGCDGDIYCHACWRDGHGTKSGQEQGHKAVLYTKRGPAAAA